MLFLLAIPPIIIYLCLCAQDWREWIALYGGQQLIDFEEKWREHQAETAAVEQAIAEVKNSLSRVESTTLDALYGSVAITKRPPTVATLSSCGPPAPFQLIRNGPT